MGRLADLVHKLSDSVADFKLPQSRGQRNMMLKGSHSSAAISWVREDLDDCLEIVRDNLEAFAEDTSSATPW